MDIAKEDDGNDGTYTLRVDHAELWEVFQALTFARKENVNVDADVQDALISRLFTVLPD